MLSIPLFMIKGSMSPSVDFKTASGGGSRKACLIFKALRRVEWVGLPESPQFCLVLRETVLKLPAPYSLLHLTRSPSSLHEIHTQHPVITFCLTYKSKLSYLHSLKREFLFDRTTPGLEFNNLTLPGSIFKLAVETSVTS